MYIYLYMHIYIYTHKHMHTCTRAHTNTPTHRDTPTLTRSLSFTHTPTHAFTRIHPQTVSHSLFLSCHACTSTACRREWTWSKLSTNSGRSGISLKSRSCTSLFRICHVWSHDIWVSHDTYGNVLTRCEYVVKVMDMRSIVPNLHESFHIWASHGIYEWVMAYMNESWHIWVSHSIYECVMARIHESWHIWMSHGTYEWVMAHMNES